MIEARDDPRYADGAPPHRVETAVMVMHWKTLTFLHWRYPAAAVQRLLPPGLEVETFDGDAWVGLVPFLMQVEAPRLGGLPWLSTFCETNVRTYVRDASGESGVWFFSLDAERLPAVAAARATWRLPYFWSRMTLDRDGDAVRYTCARRGPDRPQPRSSVDIVIGAPYGDDELTPLDHFLTARFVLFSRIGDSLWRTRAEHPAWPLRRAQVGQLEDELVAAAGFAPPESDPLAHFSSGVAVRVGMPRSAVSA